MHTGLKITWREGPHLTMTGRERQKEKASGNGERQRQSLFLELEIFPPFFAPLPCYCSCSEFFDTFDI